MRIPSAALAVPVAALLAMACNEKPAKAATEAGTTRPAGAANAAAPSATPAKSHRGGKQYAVKTRPVTLKVGGKTVHQLIIEPNKGLHFNKEFPSKFVVTPGRYAVCDKPQLKLRGGDVKAVGHNGVVSIPLTAKAAGSEKLSILASFSVCSDEQCYVLRGETLSLPVTVR